MMNSEDDQVICLDIGFEPEAAVSGPLLLQTDYTVFLTFNAVRPTADGFREDAGTGILEFETCSITKFGYPNDEALAGHPLYQKGLDAYGVYEVLNSTWIRQMTEQNRVCFPRTGDSDQRHFIILFHDSTFECVADNFRATLSTQPYKEVLRTITERVLKE